MKRLLLMFASVIGLITAGGALAGTPLGSSHPRPLRTGVAPAQTAPPARSHARRATAGVAHRHVTSRRPAQGATLRVVPGRSAGLGVRSRL